MEDIEILYNLIIVVDNHLKNDRVVVKTENKLSDEFTTAKDLLQESLTSSTKYSLNKH